MEVPTISRRNGCTLAHALYWLYNSTPKMSAHPYVIDHFRPILAMEHLGTSSSKCASMKSTRITETSGPKITQTLLQVILRTRQEKLTQESDWKITSQSANEDVLPTNVRRSKGWSGTASTEVFAASAYDTYDFLRRQFCLCLKKNVCSGVRSLRSKGGYIASVYVFDQQQSWRMFLEVASMRAWFLNITMSANIVHEC